MDEALPFTPLTSVVPFNSDLVPIPQIGLPSASLFKSAAEQQDARRGIDYLNQQYQTSGEGSEYFQRFMKDAQNLLTPNKLTE